MTVFNASIGDFKEEDCLILRRAPNNGWVVSTHDDCFGRGSSVIGAYGSPEEMLHALRKALIKYEKDKEE